MVQVGKSVADWRAAWVQVRERMRRELGDPVFEAWIGPLSLESFDHDDLQIGAAKPFVRNWVANHYVARIERAFQAEGFHPASISIVVAVAQVAVGGVGQLGFAHPCFLQLGAHAGIFFLQGRRRAETVIVVKVRGLKVLQPLFQRIKGAAQTVHRQAQIGADLPRLA